MTDQEKYSPFLAGPEETDIACLLLHGFMSTPLEMRGLGEAPLLIVHSRRDRMARPACADELYRLAAAASLKSLRWLERSHHVITIGPEREEVYRAVLAFIKERADTVTNVVHRHLAEELGS